jgi:hypothetical protein
MHVTTFAVVLLVGGFFMRRHQLALQIVTHSLWFIAGSLLWPLFYSESRWVTLVLSSVVALFVLLGIRTPAAKSPDAAKPSGGAYEGNAAAAAGPRPPRKSTLLLLFLAFACVSLLFVAYIPTLLAGMLVATSFSSLCRLAWAHIELSLSGDLGALLFPPGVRWLWSCYCSGDTAIRKVSEA